MALEPARSPGAAPSRSEQADPAASRKWVLFSVGGRRCALPVEAVARIVARQPTVALPFAEPFVVGATQVAGEVIVLLDAAKWLGVTAHEAEAVVVLRTATGPLGLLVDRAIRVVALPAAGRAAPHRDGERDVVLIEPGDLPAPASLYRPPKPSAQVALSSERAAEGQAAQRGEQPILLAFASAGKTLALPVAAVLRIRDRRQETEADRQAGGRTAVSLASILGKPVVVEEPFTIEVSVSDRSVRLAVEVVLGMRRQDAGFDETAANALLHRLAAEGC